VKQAICEKMKKIILTLIIYTFLIPGFVFAKNNVDISLIEAIKTEDVESLRQLLKDKEVIKKQLDPICDPHALCKPIVEAARKGSTEMVALLIEAGADVEGAGGFAKDTALILATMQKDFKMAELLVKNSADVNQPNYFGATPFWGACAMGLYDFVKLYIFQKADINYPGRFPDPLQKDNEEKRPIIENITPLMIASFNGHLKVVELLMRNGANINIKDTKKRIALDYAKANGNPQVIKFLNGD